MKIRVDITYDISEEEKKALLAFAKEHLAFDDNDKDRDVLKAVFEEWGGSAIQEAMLAVNQD